MRLTTPCRVCPPPASEPLLSCSSPSHPPTAVMVSAPFSPLLRGRRRASAPPGLPAPVRLPGIQGLQGDESGADGHEHDPGPVIDPHLAVDGRDVVFHRMG